ncbi:MAG: hypothetical protein ACRD9R_05285, partial [Pyrinomonadaceae bacterium]
MSQAIKEENSYQKAFREWRESERAAAVPAWLTRRREGALERFEQVGFPTIDEEEWKYTNVAPLEKAAFQPASDGERVASVPDEILKRFVDGEATETRLVFVNGAFRPELSSFVEALPHGVVVSELGAALTGEHQSLVREYLTRAGADESDGFAALNMAFTGRG